jgi:hypothetical protein
MPIDVSLFLKIASEIRSFLENFQKKDAERNERFRSALRAVLSASNETRSYLAGMKKKRKADVEKQERIAGQWSEAAVQLLEFDKDLANICRLSGQRWSDPQAWSYREINNAKRVLRVVDDRINRLLNK